MGASKDMKHISHIIQKITIVSLILTLAPNAFGALVVKNTKLDSQQTTDVENMNKAEIILTLKNDIKAIDEQMAQCKKQQKGWTAATVIGGVGILGTGIGAIVQGNQIKNKKSDLTDVQNELKAIK